MVLQQFSPLQVLFLSLQAAAAEDRMVPWPQHRSLPP